MALKYRALERLVRGFSNHRRLQMLEHLEKNPELSVLEMAQQLKVGFKTVAQHMQRLALAGLVLKRNDGHSVRHKLSRRGVQVLKFCRTIEQA